ncbi:hypothetical protein ACU3L3_11815 [Priestia endophytica]|uniref:hypothetical protein n=1 Tax=Priestia endophytica TaxID=135735 RepID=UPI003D271E84
MNNIFDLLMLELPLLLLVVSFIPGLYLFVFAKQQGDEHGNFIMYRSYGYTYEFIMTGVLLLFMIQKLFSLSFDQFKDGLFVILANLWLGSSVFILSRRH